MCGIAGYQTADGKPLPDEILNQFISALAHRGPDGTGHHAADGVGLAQTRLAIIDLKTGAQPFFGPDGAALVANGEIYNYLELRQKYTDTQYSSQSDCEVPLFSHQRNGADFAKPLRGMYAIALADAADEAMFLARDPFGIKPLYYAKIKNGLVFSSEPQAIFAATQLEPRISNEIATQLLQLQFTTGRQTIYDNVHRVLPGEALEVRGGCVVNSRSMPSLPDGPPLNIGEDEALKQLDHALMDSVSVHQRSDVPYGMFLSGGIDSSALLACMARLNERPVRAFTAGFPGTAVADERDHAKRVAKAVGAEHIEIAVTANDFWKNLPSIAAALDDPVADYAIVPTYLLAKEAARELKVVLSGEGGDELFAGYGRYRRAGRPRIFGGRAMYSRGALEGLGVLRAESKNWRQGIVEAEQTAQGRHWSQLQQAQATDIADWLPHDLLLKLDRCLMAHGVEGRTPFLDPVVANLAFRLPDHLKVRNRTGKYLLRKWLAQALPEADPFSKKRGFTVPVGDWIAARANFLGPLVAKSSAISEICHPQEVERLFFTLGRGDRKRTARACWNLLFYAVWHRINIEGIKPFGEVEAVLESTS